MARTHTFLGVYHKKIRCFNFRSSNRFMAHTIALQVWDKTWQPEHKNCFHSTFSKAYYKLKIATNSKNRQFWQLPFIFQSSNFSSKTPENVSEEFLGVYYNLKRLPSRPMAYLVNPWCLCIDYKFWGLRKTPFFGKVPNFSNRFCCLSVD